MKNTEKKISLNGSWEYLADSDGQLIYEQVKEKIKRKKTKKMQVPVNWELAGLHNFSGTVWFIKSFKFNLPGKLNMLEFEGVDYFADVWLNDTYLGNHEGYFQSFYFDVTPTLKINNLLIVKVTSPFEEPGTVWPYRKKLIKGIFNHHDCRPGAWSFEHGQDQNTGGIWNDVILHSVNNIFTRHPRISTKLDAGRNSARLMFQFPFTGNPEKPGRKELRLPWFLRKEKN